MTVGELIAKLSEVSDLNMPVKVIYYEFQEEHRKDVQDVEVVNCIGFEDSHDEVEIYIGDY